MIKFKYMDTNLDSLINAYQTCKDEKKKRLLHINIVECSMDIVKKISQNIHYKSASLNYEDIFQAGTIGLLRAIDTFDSDSNASFITYATHFIKGEIMHCIRNKDNSLNPLSLDAKTDDELSIAETISDNDNLTDIYDDRLLLTDEIEKLPDDLKEIIKMSFFEDKSQKEIAEITHTSTMYISRMVKRALNKMYKSIIGSEK